jgi:nickel/cobalt transporter (NicO) family protein
VRGLILSLVLVAVVALSGQWALAQNAEVASPGLEQQQQAPAAAKPFDKRRLLVQPRGADGLVEVVPFTDDPVLWAREEQQNFHSRMMKAMKGLAEGHGLSAGLALAGLSFLYGLLHAAGPGHGKAVISGWLLATETQLRRGIAVAFLSALFQALTAIVVVSALLLLVNGAASAVKDAARWLEGGSFALIAALGAYLVWTGVKAALPLRTATADFQFEIINPLPAAHVHGPDCGCGHVHAPDARDVAGDFSWRKAVALAFAVGLRPCTGALLVLVFSSAMGLYWAGIAATFAMALGTFITIAVVATIAVQGKALAQRLTSRDARWMGWLSTGLRLVAGSAILLFGAVMFLAALQGPVSGA